MADDPNVVVDPSASPAPETPPEPSIDDLRAQLAERDAQVKLYKDTLAALGNRPESTPQTTGTPSPSVASAPLSESAMVKELAQRYGYTEEQVQAYYPMIRDILRAEAMPAIEALRGVAEKQAMLEARLTVDDWKDIEQEAIKVAKEYQSRGVILTPSDAANLARSRMAPEIAQRRREEQAEQQRDRGNQARQAGESQSQQKAGPTTTKHAPRPKTAADIQRLPKEEREKALLEVLDQAEF